MLLFIKTQRSKIGLEFIRKIKTIVAGGQG